MLDEAEMEAITETARRIAAAAISVRTGLSLGYCYRRYAKDVDPGSHWVYLAIMARKMMDDANAARAIDTGVRQAPTDTVPEKKQ